MSKVTRSLHLIKSDYVGFGKGIVIIPTIRYGIKTISSTSIKVTSQVILFEWMSWSIGIMATSARSVKK